VIAIGGVDVNSSNECLIAGARGVAAIRQFQDSVAADLARKFVEAVHRGI
jgi:thiamine monophosphate synthase